NEHTPHRASGNGEKMDTILPGNLAQAETKVSLVHKCGRIECMPASPGLQLTMGHPPQVAVDDGKEIICSAFAAPRQLLKQLGYCRLSQAPPLCETRALMRDGTAVSRYYGMRGARLPAHSTRRQAASELSSSPHCSPGRG